MSVLTVLKKTASLARADAEFNAAYSGNQFGLRLSIAAESGTDEVSVVACNSDEMLVLEAPDCIWEQALAAVPEVGFHSFMALTRHSKQFQVRGTPLQVAQSLHAVERLFELMRGLVAQSPGDDYLAIESIVGRYSSICLPDGATPTLYWEQSGDTDKPILLMLHTAGADARQFHAVMADEQLRKQWNMVAFDLPAHGRSMPLKNSLWQRYELSQKAYLAICSAFIDQVLRQPVVLLGCSMGAAMTLKMALSHPSQVLAAIALEVPFRARGRRSPMLAHPAVNQAAHNPAYVRGLMSPVSSLFWRRVATWIYSQGGFGVYAGDLSFYSDEFDAGKDLEGLDGQHKSISILTGAYDYSATPADSARVAAMISGSRYVKMPDLGHFPMIENPSLLLKYLRIELNHILGKLDRDDR